MSKVRKHDEEMHSSHSPAMFVAATIVDTTWRMFVPTIGLLLVGKSIDDNYATKPFGIAIGIVLGSIIAAILVYRQLNNK